MKKGLTAMLFGRRDKAATTPTEDKLHDSMVRAEVQNIQAQVDRSSAAVRLNDTLNEYLDVTSRGSVRAAHR